MAVACAGDEVVDPATPQLGAGQIRDCNRAMLLAAAASAGADTVDLGIARDVEGHLEGCVDKAIAVGADVLVTSGKQLSTYRCAQLQPVLRLQGSGQLLEL